MSLRKLTLLPVGIFLLSGCSLPFHNHTTPNKPVVQPLPTAHPQPPPPTAHKTPAPSNPPRTHKHVNLSPGYRAEINTVCHAIATRNVQAVDNNLPYYQYNNGVYYGTFNKLEGTEGNISLIGQWLSGGSPRCVRYAPSVMGHGVLVTRGWPVDGGWALVEFDKFNGSWRINDFTFGGPNQVRHAFYSTISDSVTY